VSADFVRDGAALGLVEMVRGGTTCVNDMYFFNESLLVAARAAGVRVTAGLVLLDFPTAYAPTGPDEYLAKAEALVKANATGDESMIRCAAVTRSQNRPLNRTARQTQSCICHSPLLLASALVPRADSPRRRTRRTLCATPT
jgi:cytosine/adenosine deaminase-related metal-dependent hydrolase